MSKDEVQWTSCHAAPAPEEESEIAVQFFTAPYPCRNGQLDREHHELGGTGERSSMHHCQPDNGACYWPPPINVDAGGSGNGEARCVDGSCYCRREPDVSVGVNALPCTSIDLSVVGDNDGGGVLHVALQPKRKIQAGAGRGGDLGRHDKKTRASDKDNESNCYQADRYTADHVAGGGNAKAPAGRCRGSATIAQSLYARRRRERINGKLRILQNLIPNGTKVDISTMLEEAVHYVKILQLQIKGSDSAAPTSKGPDSASRQ